MAKTITEAFNTFQKDIVNLCSKTSKNAKNSRDWLLTNISKFPENNSNFPLLYPEIDIAFGSFARRTQTRPLDDIDLMVGINADECYYQEKSWDDIAICFPDSYSGRLKNYSDTRNPSHLSSTRITNAFKEELKGIAQYSSANIKRDGEAASLKLVSYPWNFDIVPCFLTKPNVLEKTYYLIPNRNGGWKKTDPRIDRSRVTTINQNNEGYILNVIRILKYWKQEKKINIGSFLLETMVLNYYENKQDHSCSQFVDLELKNIFPYLANNIQYDVSDPKNIQTNINDLQSLDRVLLNIKFNKYYHIIKEAREFESNSEIEKSINKWKEFFGNSFPSYF